MKNYKYFRVLVCLLLVCALIISISPIKAHATAAAFIPVAVPVAAPIVIGAILIGLGVSYGVSSGAFDDLIDSCAAVLSDLGDIVNNKINLYVYNNRSYVDPSIIRNVRGHLFSSSSFVDTLDKSSSLTSGTVVGKYTLQADCYAFAYKYSSLTSRTVVLIPYDFSRASAFALVVAEDGSSPGVSSVSTPYGSVRFPSKIRAS